MKIRHGYIHNNYILYCHNVSRLTKSLFTIILLLLKLNKSNKKYDNK